MTDMFPKFRAAVVQAAPIMNDLDSCLVKALQLIREAADNGANLVVFPEAWLPGYPFWAWHGRGWRAGARPNPNTRLFAQLYRNSVEIPGSATEAIAHAAEEAGTYVVVGVNERDAEYSRGTLYNTIIYFGKDGRLLGKHRKLMPTGGERLVWGMGDGSTMKVFETDIGRLGGLICWEHWMPLARYVMHAGSEQLHVALWPTATEMHQVAARHYAFEGRTFVISAASYLTPDQLPTDIELRDEFMADGEKLAIYSGGSAIIGPDGHYLAGPVYDEETILYADIDTGVIPEYMMSFDPVGHYARADVFQLLFREQELLPIERAGDSEAKFPPTNDPLQPTD